VYGVTTPFEVGLWAKRASRDQSTKETPLCFGTDYDFPTVHTIAYDLEMECQADPRHSDGYESCRTDVPPPRSSNVNISLHDPSHHTSTAESPLFGT